jgi:hypothetical protein
MRHLVVLFIHLIATLARLLGPPGVRAAIDPNALISHAGASRNGANAGGGYLVPGFSSSAPFGGGGAGSSNSLTPGQPGYVLLTW